MEGMDFTDCTIDELEQFVTGIERSLARARSIRRDDLAGHRD
jgi:hypothetical protein